MNKDYYIKLVNKLENELKKTKSKELKMQIKKEIKEIRIKNHISLYDYMKWKQGGK